MTKVSSAKQIERFNPDPGAVRATTVDLADLTPEEAKNALAYHHRKSKPVKVHKGMEGPRTGLPHLTPHSLRYLGAHAARGTKIEPVGKGP